MISAREIDLPNSDWLTDSGEHPIKTLIITANYFNFAEVNGINIVVNKIRLAKIYKQSLCKRGLFSIIATPPPPPPQLSGRITLIYSLPPLYHNYTIMGGFIFIGGYNGKRPKRE